MKIIIVDDEIAALHLFLDKIINKTDITYQFFKDDMNSIIEYVKNNDVSLAFLDIYMPNINGIDVARNLIKVNPNIKIVFVTGFIVKNEELEDIKDNVIGIINKPIKEVELEKYLYEIAKVEKKLVVNMYGSFDCFINGRVVSFSSAKSKELFALLLALNGKSLDMNLAITYLWPDKEIEKAKILYRDAVWRLRHTLKEIDFNCVIFARALLQLNKEGIDCDYWNDINNNIKSDKILLISYDWASDF